MNIYKVDSTHYRIRQKVNGKSYSVNVDHKPSQREAQRLINAKIEEQSQILYHGVPESFIAFAWQYIESTKDKLSPATIRGYESLARNMPESFGRLWVSDIKEKDIQYCIDKYAMTHSPKSTKNLLNFIKAVFHWKMPRIRIDVDLPRFEKKYEYEPTTEDVKRILQAAKGTEYEIMLNLCVLGLRRGEVLALTLDDLTDDNVLTINKDVVPNSNGEHILKNKPKTGDSNRRIAIPEELGNLIREKGYIYKLYPTSVNHFLNRTQDELGIPRFRLHMLRHFAAAYLHYMGMTDSQISAYGGWSDDSATMKRIYRYNLNPADGQRKIVNAFSDLTSQ